MTIRMKSATCPTCRASFEHYGEQTFCSRGCVVKRNIPSVLDRFWNRVQVGGPDDCWLWTGQLNNNGYARFSLHHNPKAVRVLGHRFAYMLATGENIDGKVLMHSCDNPPCVNPAHLRVGTQLDNMRDCKAKGRMNLSGLERGWEVTWGWTA